ncbi:hypothetical protein UB31_12115 [Bradyrhizobium sp. LTSP849]|nr:hypothetical protein UB31_12115 [Bradyrhizobium sp. LTSP849]
MEFALRFPDRKIVDAGKALLHQSIGGKLPIFIPVRTKPVFAIVMPFVGKPHSDPILRECPEFLNQAVIQLLRPFAPKERDYLGATSDKLRSISPGTVRSIDERDPFRIAGIPTVFGASHLLRSSLTSERWKWGAGLSHDEILVLGLD